MTIQVLDVPFSICKLAKPEIRLDASPLFFANTGEEMSLVCPTGHEPECVQKSDGWRAMKVLGPLDFSLTGILAGISGILSEARIPIFAISTYDTDYILVKEERLYDAMAALAARGYDFVL